MISKYFRIVVIERDSKRLYDNLIKRYQQVPDSNMVLYDYLMEERDRRLERAVKRYHTYEKMMRVADFVLEDQTFLFKQKDLRRYIMQQRKGGIIVPGGIR